MHFWIDKRSSQLHHYGGGRRGPAGAGGFYSQNFGTHRSSHHPPPSLGHQHRIRNRSTSTTAAITNSGSGSSNNAINNNNTVSMSTNSNNNIHSYNENHPAPSSSSANIALQYPHQQPHQVQQQHVIASVAGYSGALGGGGNSITGSTTRLSDLGMGRSQQEAYKNNNPSSLFNHPPQQQPILGGGILSISGSTQSAVNAAASMNPPMALVSGDDGAGGSSTTVLSLPPGAVTVNPSNSINVQLISCLNINPDDRGGIDISWRNPYHVPGTSISRCRAYSRDFPNSFGAGPSASSSRGTRGRRTSSSSSSGLGRNSVGTAAHASNHSQNATTETPEGMTDRSTRSEHTSFDRDTITPQRSLSLTSPETGGDQSSRVTSGRPSLENDPSWACTKRVGLTLCFLAFILLGTVGAKFMIQGPGVIDTSRTGKAEAAAYFLFTELIFVAFAMALFFTGVACLRKRTNDYLLRQFNQYILNTSATTGVSGSAMGGIPGQDAYDFEYYDGSHPPSSMISGAGSPNRNSHHHHHHHSHHGGFHNYRHQRSVGSLMEEGDYGEGDLASPPNFHGAGPIHYPPHYNGSNGGNSSRHGRSKPPPYHIALYLPLPDGMGGGSSPVDETRGNNNNEQDRNKSNKTGDAIGFIDSSSVKDAQDAGAVVNYSGSGSNSNDHNRDSNTDENGEGNQDNRSETPPPPYEQL